MSATIELNSDCAMAVVYDGECPFCRGYVTLMKLRAAVGGVVLVDARHGGPIVERLIRQGYDLNEGMAFLSPPRDCINVSIHLVNARAETETLSPRVQLR
jgi:hypothetical protein